jgi:predicted amidohydrolase
MADPTLRVAVAAVPERADGPQAALAAAERLLAAARGARLLVLPQRFLTGGAALETAAILSDAPPLRALGELARRHGIAVACGYLECCSGRIHDAALFIDERGCALANYRRTHLEAGVDPDTLAPGQWLNQVSFAATRLGLLLGADIEAPETARALALAGAAILLLPGERGADPGAITPAVLRARAFENGCAVAFANLGKGADAPPAMLVGPDGTILAQATSGLAVADLPAPPGGPAPSRLAGRRPPLYQRLTLPHTAGAPLRA